jgi:hypothetical protein
VTYEFVLIYYTKRKLTYESDALNAIAGVLGRLESRMATRFLQGLPRATFHVALLFKLGANESKDCISHRRPNHPSYSWAGWRYGILQPAFAKLIEHLNDWLAQWMWIIWYEIDPSGAMTLVWGSRSRSNSNRRNNPYSISTTRCRQTPAVFTICQRVSYKTETSSMACCSPHVPAP